MDKWDPDSLVGKGLRLSSTPSEALEGKGWEDGWCKMIAEHEAEDVVCTEWNMAELLEHDVQRLAEVEKEAERQSRTLRNNQTLQSEVSDVVGPRLRELSFGEAGPGDTPLDSQHLVSSDRAQNGQELGLSAEYPDASDCFTVEVACMYSAAWNRYKTSTLHFPKSMTWPQFHEQLRQHTLNWETRALEGCAQGLSPRNGVWRYNFERQDMAVGSNAEWSAVCDAESFKIMKESFRNSKRVIDQTVAFMVHDKLSDFSKEARAEHIELCDRTGGSGEDAISSTGYPFEKTFDFQKSWELVQDLVLNGHPVLDRQDSQADDTEGNPHNEPN